MSDSPGGADSIPPSTPSMLQPRILIPFLLITLIWSSTWIVIKDQLGTVPAVWSVTYRFLIASAALGATSSANTTAARPEVRYSSEA